MENKKVYEIKQWDVNSEKIVMAGYAKWIKIWETENKTQIIIYVNDEKVYPNATMYRDGEWELKDGIFRLSAIHKEWEEKHRYWEFYSDGVPYDEVEAVKKYENPEFIEKIISDWRWWKEKKTVKYWKYGNYFIKGAENKRTVVISGNIVLTVMGE